MSEASQKQSKKGGAIKTNTTGLTKQEVTPEKIEKARNILKKDLFSDEHAIKEHLVLVNSLEELTSKQKKRKDELIIGLMNRYALSNGTWVKSLSYKHYREALGQSRQDVIADYSCKTSLELMLADRIVASYWRAMQCDMLFNRILVKEDGSWSFDQLKVNILKELNKGIELANRQLNSNIILLKELKQPKLNVKVTTDNAYIAQNQINIEKKDENNDHQ